MVSWLIEAGDIVLCAILPFPIVSWLIELPGLMVSCCMPEPEDIDEWLMLSLDIDDEVCAKAGPARAAAITAAAVRVGRRLDISKNSFEYDGHYIASLPA
jgi:hypothetical protein